MKSLITFLATLLITVTLALPANVDNTTLVERQSCFPAGSCTRLEGDGDPHQWILHKHLGLWKAPPETKFKSTHDTDWIDGGFDVVEELTIHTDEEEHNCWGEPPTGIIACLWASIWHTDYTVRGGIANQCAPDGSQEFDHTSVIRSPNAVHGNVEYYCQYEDNCHDPEDTQAQEIWEFARPGLPPAPSQPESAALVERQNCVPAVDCSVLEGNGDPHQWILEKQISAWLDCGGTTCQVQDWEQESYTLKADTNGLTFTSGGFEVSQSVETGILEEGCTGGPGQKVCVKAAIWHTDFTVRPGIKNSCFPQCNTIDRTVIIRAPNTITHGVQYLCRYDDECHEQGHEEWFLSIAGPPPAPGPLLPPASAALEKRQRTCIAGANSGCAVLEGDGDPHQWILHKQLSGRMRCDRKVCPIDESLTKEYIITADQGDAARWIDGGFAVEWEVRTGTFGGCNTATEGAVCVIAEIWHTDYTVRNGNAVPCPWSDCHLGDDTAIIRSPNTISRGVTYSCSADCGDQGAERWVQGPAGAPW